MNTTNFPNATQFPKVTVIIPSLNPADSLLQVIAQLRNAGANDIVLVNDGSTAEHRHFFEEAAADAGVTVLTHSVNRGKGAALRTAFAFVTEHRADSLGVITVDDDLQHSLKDIIACAAQMCEEQKIILGCRDFAKSNVPKRSLLGNRITSLALRVFFGIKIDDTQTGLRAIPQRYLPQMLNIDGDRYEYETNMLLALKKNALPYTTRLIDTIYTNENKASHFRLIADSARIYWLLFGRIFKYLLSSVGCLLLETVLQTLLHDFWNLSFTVAIPFLAVFLKELCDFLPARLLSSVFNFFINKKFVFHQKNQASRSLFRYYILWAVQAVVTALATAGLNHSLGGTSGILYFFISVCVKCLIFLASYTIQKKWVFASSDAK